MRRIRDGSDHAVTVPEHAGGSARFSRYSIWWRPMDTGSRRTGGATIRAADAEMTVSHILGCPVSHVPL